MAHIKGECIFAQESVEGFCPESVAEGAGQESVKDFPESIER